MQTSPSFISCTCCYRNTQKYSFLAWVFVIQLFISLCYFCTLLFEELFLKLLTVVGTPNYYVVIIHVDLLIFSAAYKYANQQESRILGFFLDLLGPPLFGLLFIQLFDLSIQLYIVGVSHAVLTVQKRKKERRKRTLANEEGEGTIAALSLYQLS